MGPLKVHLYPCAGKGQRLCVHLKHFERTVVKLSIKQTFINEPQVASFDSSVEHVQSLVIANGVIYAAAIHENIKWVTE